MNDLGNRIPLTAEPPLSFFMRVLGIETSCDETAIAVLDFNDRKQPPTIAAEIIHSQSHTEYGGVIPELAARMHHENLPHILAAIKRLIKDSDLKSIDLIGVTTGPGLQGCLLCGMAFAEGLALAINRPLTAVNHIEGHLLSPMLDNHALKPPYIGLIVSGGHTELVHVTDIGRYERLSATIDDAAGEAFDKAANLLGFNYPGGAKLAALADTINSSRFTLPLVAKEIHGFSFSGLKTAIARLIKANASNIETIRAELAYTIQEAIVATLYDKLRDVIKSSGCNKVGLSGGVAANYALRKKLTTMSPQIELYTPTLKHCTDNAAMIAFVAGVRETTHPLTVRPRWPISEMNIT